MIMLKTVGNLKTSKLSCRKLEQVPKDSRMQGLTGLSMLRKVSFGGRCQLQTGAKAGPRQGGLREGI